MQSPRGKLVLAVAGVALLIVSAAAASTPKPSAKAVFDKRMRAIGTQAQHEILALPPTTATNPTAAAAVAGQLQTIYLQLVRRMGALTPPKTIKADFKILRASYQADARYAAAWQDAILHGTSQQAALAAHKIFLNTETIRAGNAMMRINLKGYDFGTFFH